MFFELQLSEPKAMINIRTVRKFYLFETEIHFEHGQKDYNF